MQIKQSIATESRLPNFGCVFSALLKPNVGEGMAAGAGELAFDNWATLPLRASELSEIRYLGPDHDADPEIVQDVWEAVVSEPAGDVRVFLAQPREDARPAPVQSGMIDAEYHSDDGFALAVGNLTGLSLETCERIVSVWCAKLDDVLSSGARQGLWQIRHDDRAVFRFVLEAGQVRGFRAQGPAGEVVAVVCEGGGVVIVPDNEAEPIEDDVRECGYQAAS